MPITGRPGRREPRESAILVSCWGGPGRVRKHWQKEMSRIAGPSVCWPTRSRARGGHDGARWMREVADLSPWVIDEAPLSLTAMSTSQHMAVIPEQRPAVPTRKRCAVSAGPWLADPWSPSTTMASWLAGDRHSHGFALALQRQQRARRQEGCGMRPWDAAALADSASPGSSQRCYG